MSETTPIYSPLADEEDLRELVVMYVDEMPERIERFEKALADKDWNEMSRAAHQLKGSAGSHGFGPISPIAAELEQAAKNGLPDEDIQALVEQVIAFCRRATAEPKPNV